MTNKMKGKIFNAQEVQSILNGSKVMFREVIKPYPILSKDKSYWEFKGVRWAGEKSSYAKNFGDNAKPEIPDLCPYQVGQKIFCKESWSLFEKYGLPDSVPQVEFIDNKNLVVAYKQTFAGSENLKNYNWKPAQHMKQEHSRITLQIKSVGVERLADISEEDAIKEGATSRLNCHGYGNRDSGWSMDWSKVGQPSKYAFSGTGKLTESDVCMGSAKYAFANHWNATHKKPEEKFEANPWVWKVEMEVVK